MNLQSWIQADHANIAARLQNGIVRHVPPALWSSAPPGGGSTLTWQLFHMTYHQDLAINTVVRNREPIISEFRPALGLGDVAASVGLSEREIDHVVQAIDVPELHRYNAAVHQQTADWIQHLSAMSLDTVPNSAWRLEHKAGVSPDDVDWLVSMWKDKTVGWFVQWECLAHAHTHLGEMTGVRGRLGLSPF